MPIEEAAIEGARLRFRAVMMTSFAFILGLVPLVIATGAGAASRRAVGTAVSAACSPPRSLGIFLIPGLYRIAQELQREGSAAFRRQRRARAARAAEVEASVVKPVAPVATPAAH